MKVGDIVRNKTNGLYFRVLKVLKTTLHLKAVFPASVVRNSKGFVSVPYAPFTGQRKRDYEVVAVDNRTQKLKRMQERAGAKAA